MNLPFIKQLKIIFALMLLGGITVIGFTLYRNYQFDHHPLSNALQKRIDAKEQEIIRLIHQHYGIVFDVPVIVSDKMPDNLYGVTIDDENMIRIVLNKKRMKESFDYIIEDALPHEYAHALMFYWGKRSAQDGHSIQWQETCRNLGGIRCDRFVNRNDILYGKMPF